MTQLKQGRMAIAEAETFLGPLSDSERVEVLARRYRWDGSTRTRVVAQLGDFRRGLLLTDTND